MGHNCRMPCLAGVAGFEPTNAGIKIRCLNHLATPQSKNWWGGRRESNSRPPGPQSGALTNWATPAIYLVRLKRFELLTHGLEGRCSIQLSYRRIFDTPAGIRVERVMGIGPTRPAWKAGILPLNYTRIYRTQNAVSTTPVYNSTILGNCQTLFVLFLKFFRKFFNILFFYKIVGILLIILYIYKKNILQNPLFCFPFLKNVL